MKKFIIIFLSIILLPHCKVPAHNNYIVLGDINSHITFVYLCGLTKTFYDQQAIKNRAILDTIGKKHNYKIIALKPNNNCAHFDNKLCWPHSNQQEIFTTYNYITQQCKKETITGIIGFSNGGFFLNKLVQHIPLDYPVISIGSAGTLDKHPEINQLTLIIGKKDIWHYKQACDFYKSTQNTKLNIKLIAHAGEHEIPPVLLENALRLHELY